jgi:hypothetical protein
MTKTLTYLYSFIDRVKNKEDIKYNEVNIDGSWECGKTYACKELFVKLSEIRNIALYCCRQEKNKLSEMIMDFENMFKEFGIPYIIKKEDSGYTHIKNLNSGTVLRFIYFKRHTKSSNDNKFSGLASAGNVDYIFMFLDEAYEIPEEDKLTLQSKIRGSKMTQYTLFQVCNPYNIGSEYVKYLNRNLPYNKHILSTFGQQFLIKDKKIFHHLNHRATRDIVNAEKLARIQAGIKSYRNRATTIDLGIPSYEEKSIYGSEIARIAKPQTHLVDKVVCGVDMGIGTNRNAGITSCYVGFYKKGLGVDVFNEYTQSNRVKKLSITERANQMIDFILNELRTYRSKCDYYTYLPLPFVNINVDCSSGDFIDRLNELITERKLTKVMYARMNNKNAYKINERVNLFLD